MASVAIAPAAGGLLVGPLTYFLAREAKGHGVPEVMEAVALRGGRIRPIVAVVKSIASALCIGTGGSVGREGPIVQIGSTIGSTLGQWLRLSDERVRNLVASGAAGGIAATFNTPIAGVAFALEIILGDYSAGAMGSVVIASVAASVVGRAAFGDAPAFAIPEYTINSLWEFPMYFVLGLAAALIAVIYTKSIYRAEDIFDNARRIPDWVKPAIGGMLLGGFALFYGSFPALGYERVPQVYGVGYDTISVGLLGQQAATIMLALMILKIVATSLTLGSGGSGGIFAPSLFIGSMLGGSFGFLMQHLFPGIPAPLGAYALVGMGAVFAGATQASMTAVIMMFEMTGDYKIILPLMLAVITSSLVSRTLLHHTTIYTLKLTRRGVRLRRGRDVDILEAVHVEEAMSEPTPVAPETTLEELMALFLRTNRHGFPVLHQGNLVGIVSITDLREAMASEKREQSYVRDLMTTSLVTVFPDHTLQEALRRMGPRDLSRLPVVSREDPKVLMGILRRNDIVRAYNLALARRGSGELQIPAAVRESPSVEVLEFVLSDGATCIGRTVAELSRGLPEESLLISIRRAGGEIVFPHGDTRLCEGDRLFAFARREQAAAMRRLFEDE
jgi:CIC family chloride channel protein